MTEKRRDPQHLLHRVQEEERKGKRGKLKIYLGAAPGVGKTHEMLNDAIQERQKGLDIVVGVVETHGRKDVEAMLHHLEILPKQEIEYHGKNLLEFDLDGALKRNPGLILIDEMAHENAPGSRHAKRWQDIKELLDRGVNVYTTLNVQHIESLSDDVAQIINAPIKETVPDSMIEMADTIELVDLPPEELLIRLQEGKVYFPAQAVLAAEHFFRLGNLIALRELALRVTAERVGAEVLLYRQGVGIKYIWPVRDKILVCVGPKPESLTLIRAAKRIANSLQAEWIAVYVDTPKMQLKENNRNNAIQSLRLAQELGAETRILTGIDIVKEIMNFAHERNVTQIMTWKNVRPSWRQFFFRDMSDDIVRNCGEIDVYIMTGEPSLSSSKKTPYRKQPLQRRLYALAMASVVMCTLINFILDPFLANSSLIMVYLLGVTFVATYGAMGPSILTSIFSVLAYDYFFVNTFYGFSVPDFQYLFTLVVMLLVAQIISHLTILSRRQIEAVRQIEYQTSALYTLSHQLSNTRGVDKLLDIGTRYLAKTFNCDVLALLPINNRLEVHGAKDKPLNDKEQSIAQWVYDLGQMAGLGTETLSFSNALYVPLLGSQGPVGVFRIQPTTKELFTPEQLRLIEACANQVALAIEVDRLQDKERKSELMSESSGAYNSLLNSISHDLRTPLISVVASASTLVEMGDMLERSNIIDIGKTIYYETEQLNRLINNLLQISYLESKNVNIERTPYSIKKIIDHTVKLSGRKINDRELTIDVPDHIPKVTCDHALIGEVLLNLLDNAVKFTPANSPITISAHVTGNNLVVSVEDKGPGIVTDEVNRLFEKYYRGRLLTAERGLGLGLAICRIVIEVHGGYIWAENLNDGGAAFRFTLPLSS